MDIAAIAQKLVPVAMTIAGTAKKAAIIHLGATDTYNYTTGTPGQSGGQNVPTEGILYQKKQTQGVNVSISDRFFLIDAHVLPVKPVESDTLTIDSQVWQIVNTEFDPTDTIAILQIRR